MVTQKRYFMKKAAGAVFAMTCTALLAVMFLLPVNVYAANSALEISQPRSGLDVKNRYYKAYPGLEYNVRAAVIGGAYPFYYELLTAPTGMTINSRTGEIVWLSPGASVTPYPVSLRVTDQEGTTVSVAWTITVTSDGFRFIDPVHGKSAQDGGDGTSGNPWKSLKDMYQGDIYASKTLAGYQYQFIYFRAGTYTMDAYIEESGRVPLVGNLKPQVWLAYPGESPVLDLSAAMISIYSGGSNTYIDGLTFINMSNGYSMGISIDSSTTNVTFRRNVFRSLPATAGSNNQSCLFLTRAGKGSYFVAQDNAFNDIHHAYGILGYDSDKVLIENNTLSAFNEGGYGVSTHGIGPKMNNSYWSIRGNYSYNMNTAGSVWVDTYTDTNNIEISFNRLLDSGLPLWVGQEPVDYGKLISFRNTYVGGTVQVSNLTNSRGPVTFSYDVIVNENDVPNHITDVNDASSPSRLVVTNVLSGGSASAIVDNSGNLTAAYASLIGTHGYQLNLSRPTAPVLTGVQ